MIRVFRARVVRRSRAYRALPSSSSSSVLSPPAATTGGEVEWRRNALRSFFEASPRHLHPPPLSFISSCDFGTTSQAQSGENGQPQGTPELGSVVTPETEGVDSWAGLEPATSSPQSSEPSWVHEDEEAVVASDPEEEDDLNAQSSQDCAIDMSNVPDDLKEMLKDGYEIESAEEDLSTEGVVELLTTEEVKQVLEEVRARDVQIFPVHDRCEWTDLMVVATGISDRHVRGIADALVYKIKKKGHVESPLYPTIEGQVGGKWLVVDCGNIVIHVLDEESRAYYRLEDLWTGDVRPSTADEDLEKMLKQAGLEDVVR